VEAGDFALPGAVALAVERSFGGVEWRGFRVRGRLDRADRVGDQVVLYDYKAGKSRPKGVKNEDGELKLDFQLPLYREVAPALFPGLKAGPGYYLLVGAAEAKSVKHDSGGLEALAHRLRRHLEEGRFPVDPDARQDACAYCAFDLVCRRGPRLARKGAGP
jgi:RecB family exonuclease